MDLNIALSNLGSVKTMKTQGKGVKHHPKISIKECLRPYIVYIVILKPKKRVMLKCIESDPFLENYETYDNEQKEQVFASNNKFKIKRFR